MGSVIDSTLIFVSKRLDSGSSLATDFTQQEAAMRPRGSSVARMKMIRTSRRWTANSGKRIFRSQRRVGRRKRGSRRQRCFWDAGETIHDMIY